MNQLCLHALAKSFLLLLIVTIGGLSADEKIGGMLKDGKYTKAVEYIEKSYPPGKRTVDIWLQYAEALEKSGADQQKVADILIEAQKAQPSDPRVFEKTGEFYLRQKNYQKAMKPLQKWYLLERSAKAAESMANCAMFLKEYDLARDAAESAIRIDSNTVEARKMISFIYIKDKDWAAAAEQLEFVVAKNKDDLNYLKKLVLCYEELKNREKLAEVSIRIARLDGKDIRSRTLLSEFYTEKKDNNSALPYLKELAVLTPDNASLFKNLYQISLANNQKKDAILYLRNFLVLDSTDAASYKVLGNLLYEEKNYDEALPAYRKALKLNPSITGLYRTYLAILLDKKLDNEAIAIVPKADAAGEMDAPVYAAIGMIYKNRTHYATAIPFFQNVLKTDVKNLTVLSALADCQAKTGKTADALLNYQQVVMLNPDAINEYKELGMLQMRQKKNDEAIKSYLKFLDKATDDTIARTVGLHYYEKKNYQDAIRFLEQVKNVKLHTREYLLALGDAAYQLKDCQKVCAVYSQLFTKKAPEATLRLILRPLGECYEKMNNSGKAAEAYDAYVSLPGVSDADASYLRVFLMEKNNPKVAEGLYIANIKAFPKDSRNYLRLGMLYAANKATFTKATGYLNQAVKLNTTDVVVLETLATIWNTLGNDDKELDAYTKLLALDPQQQGANRRAGQLYMKKKEYQKAITALEIAATTMPGDTGIMLLLAEGYIAVGRKDRGVELLTKVNTIQKNNPSLMAHLYQLHKEIGNTKKAEEIIKNLIELKKDNRYRIWYANDLIALKRYDQAGTIANDIVKSDPENLEGLMLQGRVLACKNQMDDAVEVFKMVLYVNNDYAPANFERAEIYRHQKEFDRAETYYTKALQADPKFAAAELGLALTYKAQNKVTNYMIHLEKARALDPANKEILGELNGKDDLQKKDVSDNEAKKSDNGQNSGEKTVEKSKEVKKEQSPKVESHMEESANSAEKKDSPTKDAPKKDTPKKK